MILYLQFSTLWAVMVASVVALRWRDRQAGYRPERRDF